MAVDYKNTVCQVKAKVPAGQNPYRGFCDILQLKIPMYLCVTNALDFSKNKDKNELENGWKFRPNAYTTTEPHTLTGVYNAIPANTLEFCQEYFRKFNKFPKFDLFLYEIYESEEQTKTNEEPERKYEKADAYVSGDLSATYYLTSGRIARYSSAFHEFLTDNSKTSATFAFKYGLDEERGLELVDAFVGVGTNNYPLKFKREDGSYSVRIDDFTKGCSIWAEIAENDYKHWFDITFERENESTGKTKSITFTKLTGGEAPEYHTVSESGMSFQYITVDAEQVGKIFVNDDIVINTYPSLRKSGSSWYMRRVYEDVVTPNIMFSFSEDGELVENQASVFFVSHYFGEQSSTTNDDVHCETFAVDLCGDFVQYEKEDESSKNDDSEEEDVRLLENPLFYLDPKLNLPEFWNTTDETTL